MADIIICIKISCFKKNPLVLLALGACSTARGVWGEYAGSQQQGTETIRDTSVFNLTSGDVTQSSASNALSALLEQAYLSVISAADCAGSPHPMPQQQRRRLGGDGGWGTGSEKGKYMLYTLAREQPGCIVSTIE